MLYTLLPFLRWFKGYQKSDLRADLIAGITVALVLIPQSMAYAQLAGLPPYYGLYASFLPPMIASLFGSSRQLATGPVAVVSLMTSASLAPLASAGSEGYIAYAILLSLAVGCFQLMLGLLKLGLVVNFLSHPVVNGFTNAAAIIIATSQLSKLFGVSVNEAEHHYETIIRVIDAAAHYTHLPSLGMGVLAFIIMYGLKSVNPRIPFVLAAVVVTTVISWAAGFEHNEAAKLEAIRAPEVRDEVLMFNANLREIEQLGAKRVEVSNRLIETGERLGQRSPEYLETAHEKDLINLELEELEELAAGRRAKIRGFLLVAARSGDGGLEFHPRGEGAPPSADGRVWRIKAGGRPIPEDAVTLIGGGQVVGRVPEGLPKISLPRFKLRDFLSIVSYAMIISLLGFMEAISIAKAMAAKTGQFLDPDRELIGQGLANIAGSMSMSYPVSGSFSRSAVNLQSGAVTGLSSVFTSLMVVIALLFFTPLLYHLPQATLAAVIMMAVVGLVSVSSFVHSWRTHRVDGAIQAITFIFVLIFAPHLDKGIMIGVGLSLGIFIYHSMRPKVAHLSLHPDLSYRDAEHWGLQECKYIAMIRFDAPLFFANASYFETLVMGRIKAAPELRHILLVANGINDMDASGEEVLALAVDNVRAAGIDFSISGLKEEVIKLLMRTHLYEKIGADHIFATQAMAIKAIYEKAHKNSEEGICPLLKVSLLDPESPPAADGEK